MRPLAELDLRHEPRLDPDDVAPLHPGHLRDGGKRRVGPLERPQLLEQHADLAVVEPRPDVAGIAQLSVLVDRKDERPERRGPASRSTGVPGDHELLARVSLELQPVARAATLGIERAAPLGDDPLEPLLGDGAEQRLPLVERVREPNGRIGSHELGEPVAALLDRAGDERLPVCLEAVEGVVDERSRASLHRREARAAEVVQGTDLAVEHGVAARRAIDRSRDRRRSAPSGRCRFASAARNARHARTRRRDSRRTSPRRATRRPRGSSSTSVASIGR